MKNRRITSNDNFKKAKIVPGGLSTVEKTKTEEDNIIAALRLATPDGTIQMIGLEYFKKCRSKGMSIDDAHTSTLNLVIKLEKANPNQDITDELVDVTKAKGTKNSLLVFFKKHLFGAGKADKKDSPDAEEANKKVIAKGGKEKEKEKEKVKAKNNKKFFVWIVLGVILIVVLSVFAWKYDKRKDNTTKTTTETDSKKDKTRTVKTDVTARNEQRATEILSQHSWTKDMYTFKINKEMDKSVAGAASFSDDAIYTPEDEVAFLNSGSDSANRAIEYLEDETDNTKDQITNSENWVSVQSLADFSYDGNTGFSNKGIFQSGKLQGNMGDIFLLYLPVIEEGATQEEIDDANKDAKASRGACGNPQTSIPVPVAPSTPTTPKTPLQSKDPSQDPAPKGNAPTGGGKNVDSGAGTYVAPENMAQPPATAYVAPAAPVAATTAPSGSTPDATPAPAAEPQAPTPEAPATGEVTVPGF